MMEAIGFNSLNINTKIKYNFMDIIAFFNLGGKQLYQLYLLFGKGNVNSINTEKNKKCVVELISEILCTVFTISVEIKKEKQDYYLIIN